MGVGDVMECAVVWDYLFYFVVGALVVLVVSLVVGRIGRDESNPGWEDD